MFYEFLFVCIDRTKIEGIMQETVKKLTFFQTDFLYIITLCKKKLLKQFVFI